jgi:cell division protein FtsB
VEMKALQADVDRLQKENEESVERIKALKSDPQTIEHEARTQLGYTRPGEVVYVTPTPPQRPPVGRAKK